MAQFIRFEIYLPVRFKVTVEDARTGKILKEPRSLDEELVDEFIRAVAAKFGGVTRWHPMGSTPYRGYWLNRRHRREIDEITYLLPVHARANAPLRRGSRLLQRLEAAPRTGLGAGHHFGHTLGGTGDR